MEGLSGIVGGEEGRVKRKIIECIYAFFRYRSEYIEVRRGILLEGGFLKRDVEGFNYG